MDARYLALGLFLSLALSLFPFRDSPLNANPNEPMTGNLRTRNFVVTAPDQQLASQIGFAAEKYRRELAKEWIGKELPDWPQPCVITAQLRREAFGETSFSFATGSGRRSQPFDFVMQVNGSKERILDSVLPHEISHTIFATHFGQPLPRWADEGACTTVEHISERRKNHQMLIEFLTTKRGIPFNRMFAMKQYPRDILPLYAQGYSLCRFFIQRGGKKKFLRFMGDGLASSNWDSAVAKHYQIKDLSTLQSNWLVWIKEGCPKPQSKSGRELVSASQSSPNFELQKSSVPKNGLANVNATQARQSLPVQNRIDQAPAFAEKSGSHLNEASPTRSSNSRASNFYLSEIERMKSKTILR